jgi:hypothetical protein
MREKKIMVKIPIKIYGKNTKKNIGFNTRYALLKIFEDDDIITIDTKWENKQKGYADVLYVIAGRLHIKEGITLTIQDNTKVLLVNGDDIFGQVVFATGSKLDVGIFGSYAIDASTLNEDFFDVGLEWEKGYDIIPRSTIANNGGYCFYGNNCPSKNRTSEISEFGIGTLSGERLGSFRYAAINVYDMRFESLEWDSIDLANCINNLFLKASDVEIKKCSIENAVNSFVIEGESSLTVTARLAVQCDTLIHEAFDGSFAILDGAILDITAGQTGFDMRINEKVYLANQEFTLTSNKKKTWVPLIAYNAGDALVNQDEPEEIEAE